MQQRAAKLFAAVDSLQDERLDIDEVLAYLTPLPWARWFLTEDYFYDWRPSPDEHSVMSAEVLRNRAEDTVTFLDTDDDGRVHCGRAVHTRRVDLIQ